MRSTSDEEAVLQESAARIEHLLGELEQMAGPLSWPRIEELVERLVSVYGAGLQRLLDYGLELSADRRNELEARVTEDPLVAGLLVLQGAHPLSLDARVQRALDEVREELGAQTGKLALLELDEATLTLRVGVEKTPAALEPALRNALERQAPEVTRIEVASDEVLVQIGRPTSERRP